VRFKLPTHNSALEYKDMYNGAITSHSERHHDAELTPWKHGDNKHASPSHLKHVKYLDTEYGTYRRAERILTPPARQDIGLVHGMLPMK